MPLHFDDLVFNQRLTQKYENVFSFPVNNIFWAMSHVWLAKPWLLTLVSLFAPYTPVMMAIES